MVNGTFLKEMTSWTSKFVSQCFRLFTSLHLPIDPLSAIPYTIDTEYQTEIWYQPEGSYVHVDGKVPTESTDKTSFIVSTFCGKCRSIDKKLTAINRIKRMPYTT